MAGARRPPGAYLLGFIVLAVMGRFRPGGVWVTSTRILDEHFGLRSELALTDIAHLVPGSGTLLIVATSASSLHHQRLTPPPWRSRVDQNRLVVHTGDLAGGSEALAAAVRSRTSSDLASWRAAPRCPSPRQ